MKKIINRLTVDIIYNQDQSIQEFAIEVYTYEPDNGPRNEIWVVDSTDMEREAILHAVKTAIESPDNKWKPIP